MNIQMKLFLLFLFCINLFACDKPDIYDFHRNIELTKYIKLDAKGKVLDPEIIFWNCTQDATTGLTWENKTDNESAQDHAWTYIWYIPDQGNDKRVSLNNDGSCNRNLIDKCSTDHHIRYLNKIKLCGFNDWRLPQKNELETIIDNSRPDQIPKICDCFFSNTKPSSYWTITETPKKDKAFAVNFKDASGDYFAKYGSFYIRAVRGDILEN